MKPPLFFIFLLSHLPFLPVSLLYILSCGTCFSPLSVFAFSLFPQIPSAGVYCKHCKQAAIEFSGITQGLILNTLKSLQVHGTKTPYFIPYRASFLCTFLPLNARTILYGFWILSACQEVFLFITISTLIFILKLLCIFLHINSFCTLNEAGRRLQIAESLWYRNYTQ